MRPASAAFSGYDFIHRLVHDISRPGGATLELGCGVGFYRSSVRGRYLGTDVTNAPYHEGQTRQVDVVCSGSALPFVDEAFDLVFSVAAFDFFPDLQQAVAESRRVLRPGGHTLIITYNWWTLRKVHRLDSRRRNGRDSRTDPYQRHVYTTFGVLRLLRHQGFSVRFLRADLPRTPWKRALLRIPAAEWLWRVGGRWLVLDASLPTEVPR